MKFIPGLFFITIDDAFLKEISLPDPGAIPIITITGFVGSHAKDILDHRSDAIIKY